MIPTRIDPRYADRDDMSDQQLVWERMAQDEVTRAASSLRDALSCASDPDARALIEDAINTLPNIDEWNERIMEARRG